MDMDTLPEGYALKELISDSQGECFEWLQARAAFALPHPANMLNPEYDAAAGKYVARMVVPDFDMPTLYREAMEELEERVRGVLEAAEPYEDDDND